MHRHWIVILAAVAAGGACGSGDDSGPTQSPLVIAKTATKSGDAQVGLPGQPLPSALRIVVTRDAVPESGVAVTWSTGTGSLAPASDQTDANGESATTWTLGDTPGQQTATARVTGATGSPVTFTATATGGPSQTTIQVLGPAGGNRFSPENITVPAGTTVTWQWGTGAVSHNVVPDDGVTPATSGPVTDGPHIFQFTFNTPGMYHYHCASHGLAGGIGMAGTVTVTPQP